ncbi:hypothetical protein [Shewanella frigidimarina]|uniref:hypothetical protein n=1 Tax=Shewanella frigidimarina TaxID=56812 RepID=UPI000E7E8E3B|nr:hypothetical protein [Shewanella frigidimarina]RPA61558.1 hypothetical protein EGC86_10900 [Shewanella frigidimarina]HBF45100.1 hypothetical protein [Shewanella frigidimarina]|tara:strand:- start:942 stop:1877 length:936 start_codon:yes stop_codon:yes gene_type:complete
MHTRTEQIPSSSSLSGHYQQITVIGNAHGDWQPADIGHTFIFNGTEHDADNVINICNGPYAGSHQAFVVSNSLDDNQLVSLLTEVGEKLEGQLNCWPSSGLATILLMSLMATQVNVQRMSLLPSLARPNDMPASEHLPCMVHNWLGERRIALGLQLTNNNIQWPELFVDDASTLLLHDVEPVDINPFEVLLSDAVRRRQNDILTPDNADPQFKIAQRLALQVTTEQPDNLEVQYALLAALSNLPSVQWLTYANQSDLIMAESLFYNQYPQTASYWYLIDNQASQYLDTIRHHLAYCQQVIALTAKQANADS